jgi:hypothetical protein
MKRFSILQNPIDRFPNPSKLRKILLIVFIPLLASSLLLFLNGCGIIKSAELRALENAASVLQLTTGREVERRIQDKGTALGKPVYAEILIVYEPINHHTRKEIYDEIVAILKKNHWQGNEPLTGHDFFKATLQQSGFEISTDVLIDSDENLVKIYMTIY